MKPKHVEARIKQCLAIADCSPCPRRKFGALLLDPARNVLLMDGYNGGPRGGGEVCGGDRCLRDGVRPEDVAVVDMYSKIPVGDPGCSRRAGEDDDDVLVRVGADRYLMDPVSGKTGPSTYARRFWLYGARAAREKFLEENPPIRSGTRYEVGCHHAEMNVVTNAAARGVATDGAWLIVTGEPCILCAKLLHHAGIAKVICVKGGFLGGDDGPKYLRAHGVEVEYVDGPQDPRALPPVQAAAENE
jgi:deoxycytidylate deaminase